MGHVGSTSRIERDASTEVVTISILSLRPGESPRLKGEDKEHVRWLAETDAALPPILVDRRTMCVVDGMHRLTAAALRGRHTIDAEFFDGNAADAFLRAVEANVTHGLPLSQSDRRAAASRIIQSHPHMSDRAIAESTGLSAKTVAAIRRRSTDDVPQLNARVGRDGRVRPVNAMQGRQRVAELLAANPTASLRELARGAGVSPATVRAVRMRVARGAGPVPGRPAASSCCPESARSLNGASPSERAPRPAPAAVLEKLARDPSLRHNQHGRWLLRLLHHNAVGVPEWSGVVDAVPPHCAAIVVDLARLCGQTWLAFAQELEERTRWLNPG